MQLRFAQVLFSILIVVVVLAAAQEPVKPQLTPSTITATRQVTLFAGLEKQMLQAVQRKDKPALEAMVSDDFQIEMPDADALAGADWIDSVVARDFTMRSFLIRQVSVADLGDAAVVKYGRIQQATFRGGNVGGEFFVVDVWRKNGDSWKLANRFTAKVGEVPASTRVKPRPTGKE